MRLPQVRSMKQELLVKDRQIETLRDKLADASAAAPACANAGGGGGNGGGGSDFEEALREEMECMRVGYERRIAALQTQLEAASATRLRVK